MDGESNFRVTTVLAWKDSIYNSMYGILSLCLLENTSICILSTCCNPEGKKKHSQMSASVSICASFFYAVFLKLNTWPCLYE